MANRQHMLMLRLSVLLVWTSISFPRVSTALEWPYSEVFSSSTSQVANCAKASGFSFRNSSQPNVQQLARMCADPDCIFLTDYALTHLRTGVKMAVFLAFAEPVINYCWYFRAPGDPCPTSPIKELLTHVKDKDASCQDTTGVSLLTQTDSEQLNQFAVFYAKNTSCGPDCLPLLMRVKVLAEMMSCPANDREMFTTTATALFWTCVIPYVGPSPRHPYPLFFFTSSDWPVPVLPTPPPSSPATPSSSDSVDDDEAPKTDEASGSKTSDDQKPATPRTPNSTQPKAATSNQSEAEDIHNNDVSVASTTELSKAPPSPLTQGSNSTMKTAPSEDHAHESTTTPPTNSLATKSSNYATIQFAGVAAVFTVSLVAMFIYMRRRRSPPREKDGIYSSVMSPVPAASIASPRDIEAVLGITKICLEENLQEIRMIGAGGYGVVYLVRDTLNNRLLASKRLIQNQITDDTKIDGFFDEIRTVSKLHHPCIVAFVGATWTNRTDVQALFEYMDGGDLRTYLESTPVTSMWTSEKFTIAMDIADALVYVHSELPSPLVHRDLKSRNVLLSKSPLRAKLSDFGVAREVSQNESMTNGVGTSRWLAPEVILGRGDYGTACDIYSFGVVLSELDTHKIPFWDCGGDGLDSMLPEITIMRMVALEGRQPSFLASCPPTVRELARQCLAHDPQERPTAAAVASTLQEIMCRASDT